jgi:hypothetical protein
MACICGPVAGRSGLHLRARPGLHLRATLACICGPGFLRETVEHQTDKLRRELQQARSEIERLTLERDFYSKRALALEQHNREVTEAATKYSLWGQRLERELAKIDPDGARARQFGAWSASQVSALEPLLRGAA